MSVCETNIGTSCIDLIVECHFDKTEKPKISDIKIGAPKEATVSFTLPNEVNRAPSEFEKLVKEITTVTNPEEMESLAEEDFSYISTKLNLDINLLKRVAHAHVLAKNAKKTGASVDASIRIYTLLQEQKKSILSPTRKVGREG